jgi:putative DNA primase/helicase
MTFFDFVTSLGLIVNQIEYHNWVRTPTVDHPRKRNGSYIFDGVHGAAINYAVHDKHVIYRSEEPHDPVSIKTIREQAKKADEEKQKKRSAAERQAAWLMKSAIKCVHPYLARKGFPEMKSPVFDGSLILPMRVDGRLVGCQRIWEDGQKRFLSGQLTKGASLIIDNKGRDVVVEGYATALSVRRAFKELRQRYTIHVCFSASNMIEVGRQLKEPLVIADHDPAGINAAEQIASRYWLGKKGEDFNDAEIRQGTLAVSASLALLL